MSESVGALLLPRLLNEITDLNKWKDISVYEAEDLILLIWQYFPSYYTDSTNSYQNVNYLLCKICQSNPENYMYIKGSQKSQNNLEITNVGKLISRSQS